MLMPTIMPKEQLRGCLDTEQRLRTIAGTYKGIKQMM
jgi:DNA-binding FrmR family transcriptional regulator